MIGFYIEFSLYSTHTGRSLLDSILLPCLGSLHVCNSQPSQLNLGSKCYYARNIRWNLPV